MRELEEIVERCFGGPRTSADNVKNAMQAIKTTANEYDIGALALAEEIEKQGFSVLGKSMGDIAKIVKRGNIG